MISSPSKFDENKYCDAMICKLSIFFAALLILCSAQGIFAQEQVDWQEYETEHFVIRYHELDENTLSIIVEEAENAYDKVTSDLQYQPDNKTIIRIGSNKDHEWDKWGGSYLIGSNLIDLQSSEQMEWIFFATYGSYVNRTLVHEFTHHIISEGYMMRFPEWLGEGIATYEAEEKPNTFYGYRKFKNAAAKNELHSLDDMLIFDLLEDDERYVAYIESYTVIEYIVNTYGHDGVADILKARKENPDMHQIINDTFGVSYEEFELGWIKFAKEKYGKPSYDYYLCATLYFVLIIVLLKWRSRRRNQIMEREGD